MLKFFLIPGLADRVQLCRRLRAPNLELIFKMLKLPIPTNYQLNNNKTQISTLHDDCRIFALISVKVIWLVLKFIGRKNWKFRHSHNRLIYSSAFLYAPRTCATEESVVNFTLNNLELRISRMSKKWETSRTYWIWLAKQSDWLDSIWQKM